MYGDSIGRQLRRFAAPYPSALAAAVAPAAGGGARRARDVRRPEGAVPVLRGEHRAGRRALVRQRPAGRRGAGVVGGARAAAADGDRRGALRGRGIVNSIPIGEAVRVGAKLIFVLQVGRVERPLTVPRRPWEVAQVAFEIARRHRFARELASLPRRRTRARAARRRRRRARRQPVGVSGHGGRGRRISRAYTASRRYLAANVHPMPAAGADAAARSGSPHRALAPLVVVLAVALLTALPLWLLLALAASPLVPATSGCRG